MIEINTIQDIRNIDSKLIGEFSFRQLISFLSGGVVGVIVFLISRSLSLSLLISVIVVTFGVVKVGNLTAFEYLTLVLDRNRQPRIRVYKNKNLIAEIEKQCNCYKSPKKKRR